MTANEKYNTLEDYMTDKEFYALDVATTAFGLNDETIDNVLYAMFGYEWDNIGEIFAGIYEDRNERKNVFQPNQIEALLGSSVDDCDLDELNSIIDELWRMK